MSAASALQTAVVARLTQVEGLGGAFLDVPARAPFPYAVVECGDEREWCCSGREGREIVLQVSVWDSEPSRLLEIEGRVQRQLSGTETAEPWHLSTLVLTGKRRTCKPAHPWSCTVEMRARLIERSSGAAA